MSGPSRDGCFPDRSLTATAPGNSTLHKRTFGAHTVGEGSERIPKEVADGQRAPRYLNLSGSVEGVTGRVPGRPRQSTASGSQWERCNTGARMSPLVAIS